MKLKYFDIHSHLNFRDFNSDRKEIIEKMKEEGVMTITVGTDLESSKEAIELAEKEEMFATIGLHPNDYKEGFDFNEYKKLAEHPKVVAIGECGLDYFRTEETEENKEGQKKLFHEHVKLALEVDKPLMIHCRNAYEDLIEILEEYKDDSKLRGNIHFFAGDKEIAQKFLDLGFTLSFTGVLTFTHDYDEVVRLTPLNMIMSETDSPYVAPVPHRGQRNNPLYVIEVAQKIAEIKEVDEEEMAKILMENVERVFGIKG